MDMIKVTGVFKAKDKHGNTYLSGSLSNLTNLLVMPNKFRRNERDPDYIVYIGQKKKKEETPAALQLNDDL